MEQMYQKYKQIAEFHIIYISEAHAIDSQRPQAFARQKGIFEAQTYGQRCTTAAMMLKEEHVTIPCLVDDIENQVGRKYQANPDRIYVVRTDGRLAVAADRGPWGFKPALMSTQKWLAEYASTGVEPGHTD